MPVFVKPFSAIVEDVMSEMSENSTDTSVRNKYKRRVNDIYVRDIPSKFEWDWLTSTGQLTLQASYNIGTVSVTNLSTAVVGTGTSWTSAMSGMKFTIASTGEIYTFTYLTATTATISPAYQGTTNGSAGYSLFQDTYSLASDFSRVKNVPGFYYDYSTGRVVLEWYDDTKFFRYFTTVSNQFPVFFREFPTKDSNGLYQVQIQPPVNTSRLINYEYVKALQELKEFRTGTATSTSGSNTVTTSADYSSRISAGQYFRMDDDGTWDKITTVSGTTLTLQDNYTSTLSSKSYTVCDAPDMPYAVQQSLFYGACYLTATEQGDAEAQPYMVAYLRALDLDMARRNRKRYGRQYMRRGKTDA